MFFRIVQIVKLRRTNSSWGFRTDFLGLECFLPVHDTRTLLLRFGLFCMLDGVYCGYDYIVTCLAQSCPSNLLSMGWMFTFREYVI